MRSRRAGSRIARRLNCGVRRMTQRRRNPSEKKAISYSRDRRNVYGENSKASRKGIRVRKRLRVRAERRAATIATAAEPESAELSKSARRALGAKHRMWSKVPDAPLGAVISKKLQRRKSNRGA